MWKRRKHRFLLLTFIPIPPLHRITQSHHIMLSQPLSLSSSLLPKNKPTPRKIPKVPLERRRQTRGFYPPAGACASAVPKKGKKEIPRIYIYPFFGRFQVTLHMYDPFRCVSQFMCLYCTLSCPSPAAVRLGPWPPSEPTEVPMPRRLNLKLCS